MTTYKNKRKFIKSSVTRRSLGVIRNLGALLDVSLKKSKVTRDLVSHPDYPSMLAMSDVLQGYGINNQGVILNKEVLREQSLPMVCVLNTEESEGISVIVSAVNDDVVEYLDPVYGYITESIDFFREKWLGHALLIDPVPDAEKVNDLPRPMPATLLYKGLIWLVPILLLFTAVAGFIQHNQTMGIVLSLFNFAGVYLSIALLHEELDSDDIKSLCGLFAAEGCSVATQSKLSRLVPALNLSEIGFLFYFATAVALAVFSLITPDITLPVMIIAITSFAGVVFSFISFYYQVNVLKTWCMVCNLIALVNWALLVTACLILTGPFLTDDSFQLSYVLLLLNIYLVVTLFASVIRQWLTVNSKSQSLDIMIGYLNKSTWFYDVLKMNSRREKKPIQLHELVFGNPGTPTVARLVLNPYSWMCKTIYNRIKEAHINGTLTDYRVELRMTTLKSRPSAQSMFDKLIQQCFIFTNESMEEKQAIFDACFASEIGSQPLPWMQNRAKTEIEYDMVQKQIDALTNWIDENDIVKVPTLIVDGYIVPDVFLLSFIDRMLSGNAN